MKKLLFALAIGGLFTMMSCGKCKDVDCQNGGTCTSGDCECTDFYTGSRCADELRDTYVGSYKGTATLTIFGNSSTEAVDTKVETNGSGVQNLKVEMDTNVYVYVRIDDAESNYTVTGDNDPNFDWTGNGKFTTTTLTANLSSNSILGLINVSMTATKQ